MKTCFPNGTRSLVKGLFFIVTTLLPLLAFSDDTYTAAGSSGTQSGFNFNPPAGDYSVIFLSNIFGIVEGVLHGTGSQVVGNMMAVFNTAVLGLGSILIMYTLIVGTMNTAHEGQFLGQKWSSIWVPMRSVAGMSLLIPQASGYCIMQIFVMWVVVQGVGAADKIWSAALNYLNRGGVLVQAQMNPTISLNADGSQIAQGAATILQAQVCMLALQYTVEAARTLELAKAQTAKSGHCYQVDPNSPYYTFCNQAVPDFISSVNVVSYQQQLDKGATQGQEPTSYTLNMPNQLPGIYANLNGVCGTLAWNNFFQGNTEFNNLTTYGSGASDTATLSVSENDLSTAKLSRAIAIQQMYVDLAIIAQAMVNNSPLLTLGSNSKPDDPNYAIPYLARDQFGIPMTDQGVACEASSLSSCKSWGPDPKVPAGASTPAPALFNGTEFQGAITDYNAIMLPTLRLLKEAQHASTQRHARAFIFQAEQSGWLMAGSYFFDLARLNAEGENYSNLTDRNTGLANSTGPLPLLKGIKTSLEGAATSSCRPNDIVCLCQGSFPQLCIWLYSDQSSATQNQIMSVAQVMSLLNASNLPGATALTVNVGGPMSTLTPTTGVGSTSVIGFINNSMIMQLQGQPGATAPAFNFTLNIPTQAVSLSLPDKSFSCSYDHWYEAFRCFPTYMLQGLYDAAKVILDVLINMVVNTVLKAIDLMIRLPMMGMAQIFVQGIASIEQPSINPIIALSQMGVTFINFAVDLWIYISVAIGVLAALPIVGAVVSLLVILIMPFIGVWMAIMVILGFTTAYYIPFLPYMIFTFASIGWLMAVIEAMVAAPIVALGVCFPTGDEAFGKSEGAILILMNVFLRPAMMIIGYIAAIILTYVSVWIINAGFSNAIMYMEGSETTSWTSQIKNAFSQGVGNTSPGTNNWSNFASNVDASNSASFSFNSFRSSHISNEANLINQNLSQGYAGWAGTFGFFMSILLYTMMYLTVVQEAFNLITMLPDKVLRWIGGQAETLGGETAKWTEQTKGQMAEAGKQTALASEQMGSKLQESIKSKISSKKGGGGTVGASETEGGGPEGGPGGAAP